METALQITQLLTNIVVILLFGGILAVLINLIKNLKKLNIKVESFSKDFSDVKPKLVETIEKINYLTDNFTLVVKNVNDNIEVLGTVVDKVKDTADNIIEFEQKIQNSIEPPVMDTLNTITAVSVGVKTFFDTLKKNKTEKLTESGYNYNDHFSSSEVSDDVEELLSDEESKRPDIEN
ncbi:MAG TPA: hypothetical protein PKA90_00955 [Ignavibacteria bacterium]|nr:hypothetical protein [Ignavibacteria bacterium]HMR38974.1 hypothetical protein [Ignavibacteria bacterium]